MATFCFCPPESDAKWRARADRGMPMSARAPAPRAPPPASRGTAKFSSPNSTSSSTTDVTNWLSTSWQTLPTTRDRSVSAVSPVSSPSTATEP